MRKAFRHSGVLMMVAVVALGLLGAAYTLWYEDLQLNATVTTGTFDADVSVHDIGPNDNEGLPVVAQVGANPASVPSLLASNYAAFGPFPVGKPATTCDASESTGGAPLTANDATDDNVLTLTMGGLYPYAGCEYDINIDNLQGSVPFHVAITNVTLEECEDNTFAACDPIAAAPWSIGLANPQTDLAECAAFLGAIPTFDGPEQIEVASIPVQIHNGEELRCRFKLILDQDPTAEGNFYKFTATYRAYQWNEAPYAAP